METQAIHKSYTPPPLLHQHVYKMSPLWCIISLYGKILIVFAHLLGRDPTVCNRLQRSKLLLLAGQNETMQNRQPHGGSGALMGNMLHRWEKPLWHQIMSLNFYTLICCGKVNHRTGRCGQNSAANTLSHWMSQRSFLSEPGFVHALSMSATAWNITYTASAPKWVCVYKFHMVNSKKNIIFCLLLPHKFSEG